MVQIGRVRRAFGLKGELVVHASTDEPGELFAPGRRVFADVGDRGGDFAAGTLPRGGTDGRGDDGRRECIVETSRPFKDAWLVKLAGVGDKTEADRWRGVTFAVPHDELTPPDPDENEVYRHELVGMQVRDEPHGELGLVAGWYELPQGLVLEVRGAAWHADVPFNEAFIAKVDREARVIDVRLPEGLLEKNVPPG